MHHPIIPENPPDLNIEVRSTASVDEHAAYKFTLPLLAALTLGLAYGLPDIEDLAVQSAVVVRDRNGELLRFQVSTRTRVYYPQLFRDRANLEALATEQAAVNHGRAIAAQVTPSSGGPSPDGSRRSGRPARQIMSNREDP